MNKAQKVNIRKIASMLLFFLIIILFLTAVGIEILKEIIEPEVMTSQYLNPENQSSNIAVELLHIITTIHAFAGIIFVIFGIFHIKFNWKVLKGYLCKNKKEQKIGKM